MIIKALLSVDYGHCLFYKKKQRKEDERMKKKVLAFLLASTMVIEPFSVAGAADFSDGTGQEADMQFSDDAEDVPEVKNDVDGVDQFSTDAAGEDESSSKQSEDAIQMGDDVWFRFDESTGTATISGTGDMWDYYTDGYDKSGSHKNPFIGMNQTSVKNIIIENGITSVGNYFLYEYAGVEREDTNVISNIILGKDIKRIGDYAFTYCYNVKDIVLPEGLEEIGENAFGVCGNIKEIVIPDSIKILGKSCFSKCRRLSSVIFPDNLENISDNAFSGCGISELNLPLQLKYIGNNAFIGNNLKKIKMSSNIEYIGNSAFYGCGISEITLPKSIKKIGASAFYSCTDLTTIKFEEGITCNIPSYMFGNCVKLNKITIPNTVQEIEGFAFDNCFRLTTIIVEGDLTQVASEAFIGCSNISVIKGCDCSYIKQFYNSLNEDQKEQITFESLGEGSHQFTAEKVQIKEPTCTEKGTKAYKCEICGELEDEEEIPVLGHNWNDGIVIKPATETEEGEIKYTCWRCDETKIEVIPKLSAIKFEYVNFGWNLYDKVYINGRANKAISYYITTVDKDASAPEYDKAHDTQLSQNGWIGTNISMPDKEVDIYIFAADDEGNHTYYKVTPNYNNRPQKPSNTVKVGNNIIATIDGDTMTFVGSGETYNTSEEGDDNIWYQAGINTHTVKHIVFKEEGGLITDLGEYLFSGFDAVEDIELPKELKRIGAGAFQYCKKLQKMDIPQSVEEIGEYTWMDTGIETINWPQNVKEIQFGVFDNCSNLKSFFVPESVTEINNQAFYNCINLTEITIPRSVTHIGDEVFRNCRNLTIYGYKDSATESYAKANTIKFVSADYSVVFKDNGRTKKIQYVLKGGNATPPTLPAKEGYTLSWDADYTNVTEDMVINAVWTKKDNGSSGGGTTIIVTPSETTKYTVTFKDRGEIVKTEKVKSGDAAEYPFISRNGYKLSWDKDFSKITADTTVNAVWTVIKPEKVTSLTAEIGKNSIDLSWDETEFAGYYLVYRKADSEKEYTQIAKTTKILWTDSKAVPGTQYSYKVVAVRSLEGEKYQGEDSDIVTAKIGTPQVGDIYSVGDLSYKIMGDKEVGVIGSAKATDTLTIPSSVTISGKVYKVTSIQEKAFYRNEDIVNVTIGNNVTYVGKYTFYQCPSLETVKFGKRVSTISTCAFTQCPNLEDVTLPASVKRLGAKAFYQCTSIETLKINSSALEYIGKKGLAVNKSVTLQLPKKLFTKYQKLIKASNIYSKTKFVKF